MVNLLGNNDLDGSYTLPLTNGTYDSPWMTAVAPYVWSCCFEVFKVNFNLLRLHRYFFSSLQKQQADTFKRGGYFHQEVMPNVHVLSLNTIIYSPSHRPTNVTMVDPFGQLEWLEATLNQISAQYRASSQQLRRQRAFSTQPSFGV